ncbi:lysine transporter LysE [Paramagnetospirillum marisnigri]|uniref:Lysine transporter LysE n=1 Tax=Paramagnetospirillum marisnigri TaxID=1285242 RepID=A0A178M7L4_9PROT|nr:LysE family translocator [Paramagnetospirillum marisnigri]OAN44750.1 lysine transporter LysE [Paramagnetospirillum marisnigri]
MALEFWQAIGFLGAAVLVTLSPGPDNLMILGLGMSRGRRQGMAFGFGCALGCLSHTVLAALGISALIAASAWAFLALKIMGGMYLLWLGIQALRSSGRIRVDGMSEASPERLLPLFAKGLVANAVNPKVVLFFLAFLPQFVVEGTLSAGWQIGALGLLFSAQAVLLFGLIGYGSGWIGQRLVRAPRAGLWLDRLAGGVFIGLGVKLMAAP